MFNISLSEWLIIGAVALLVLGPEHLPEVARTAGRMVRKIKRFVADVQQDLGDELKSEDLAEFRKLHEELTDARQWAEQSSRDAMQGIIHETQTLIPEEAAPKPKRRRRRRRPVKRADGAKREIG